MTAENSFNKTTVHSQGGTAGKVPGGVGSRPRLFGIRYSLYLSGLGGAVMYSGVVSNGGGFQSFEGLLLQVS